MGISTRIGRSSSNVHEWPFRSWLPNGGPILAPRVSVPPATRAAKPVTTSVAAIMAAYPRWARLLLGLLAVLYIGAWMASPVVTNSTLSDLDRFFWPAAEAMLHGSALHVYSLPGLAFYPVANGPLGLIALLPAAAVANALGIARDVHAHAVFGGAVVGIFSLLMSYEALRLILEARARIEWPFAASLVFLAAPALWIGVADFGHIEQPLELWLVLAAGRRALGRHYILAGMLLGLGLLTRTTAVLSIIPFAAIALADVRWRATTKMIAAAAVTAAVGIAPFLIADGASTIYSLLGYRGALRIAGGTAWFALAGSPVASLVQHGDSYIVVVAAVATTAFVSWRRPQTGRSPAGLTGLLTIAALCFPALAKTSYPYYLIEGYVFSAVWWLARAGSAWNWRVIAPFLITSDVFLGKWAETIPAAGTPYVQAGIASSAVLAFVAVLIAYDLLRDPIAPPLPRSCAGATSVSDGAAPELPQAG